MGLIGLSIVLGMIGFASETMMVMAMTGILFVGIMITITNGPINAILQSSVDPAMQGAGYFTLVGSLASAMTPLGLILAGPISEFISIQIWYIMGGILTLAFGTGGFFSKALMSLGEEGKSAAE